MGDITRTHECASRRALAPCTPSRRQSASGLTSPAALAYRTAAAEHTTFRSGISSSIGSFRTHNLRTHNFMAMRHLVEARTIISTMCDQKVSAPRPQLIHASLVKGVGTYGIPPRGAPD